MEFLLVIRQIADRPLTIKFMIDSINSPVDFIFSKINRKLAPKLLICLSSSLLILLIIFIIGAERRAKTYHVCQLMAVLIHYFTLSTFCWMACESFNLYRNFINIFKRTRNENGILAKMSLFSWGKCLLNFKDSNENLGSSFAFYLPLNHSEKMKFT